MRKCMCPIVIVNGYELMPARPWRISRPSAVSLVDDAGIFEQGSLVLIGCWFTTPSFHWSVGDHARLEDAVVQREIVVTSFLLVETFSSISFESL